MCRRAMGWQVGFTPLVTAAALGHVQIVGLLVEARCNIELPSTVSDREK